MVKLTTVLGKWEKVVCAEDAEVATLYKVTEPLDTDKGKVNDVVVLCVREIQLGIGGKTTFLRLSTGTFFPLESYTQLTLLPPGTKATIEQLEK